MADKNFNPETCIKLFDESRPRGSKTIHDPEISWSMARTQDLARNLFNDSILRKTAADLEGSIIVLRHIDHTTTRDMDYDGSWWRFNTDKHVTIWIYQPKKKVWKHGDVFVKALGSDYTWRFLDPLERIDVDGHTMELYEWGNEPRSQVAGGDRLREIFKQGGRGLRSADDFNMGRSWTVQSSLTDHLRDDYEARFSARQAVYQQRAETLVLRRARAAERENPGQQLPPSTLLPTVYSGIRSDQDVHPAEPEERGRENEDEPLIHNHLAANLQPPNPTSSEEDDGFQVVNRRKSRR